MTSSLAAGTIPHFPGVLPLATPAVPPTAPSSGRPVNPVVQAHRALLAALLDAEKQAPATAPAVPALAHAQQATAVALLADDPLLRETLAGAAQRRAAVEAFADPHACMLRLREEAAQWQADARAQRLALARWLQGEPLVPQVARYLRERAQRAPLVNVLAADAALLAAAGPEVIAELVDWPGHRILLVDSGAERRALHRCLGDYFLDKRAPDLGEALATLLADLGEVPHPRTDGPWRATLDSEQQRVLHDGSVAEDLAHYARQNFSDWVLLGEPFGVLGHDRSSGALLFLQLELRSELPRLARLAARAGKAPDAVAAIRAGNSLFDVDLRQSLCSEGTASVLPAFGIGYTGELLGAIRPL